VNVYYFSVQEAKYGEYAGTFGAAKIATGEHQALHDLDLGYPQRSTVIYCYCDNEVAVGLANKSVKQKLSKSCDMRLN
jgi:hypothetical protein